jgi:hypothetical protein
LKFDLLGLGMLSALHYMIDLIAVHHDVQLDLGELDLADPAVYDMLCAADAVGVFQVESRAQLATSSSAASCSAPTILTPASWSTWAMSAPASPNVNGVTCRLGSKSWSAAPPVRDRATPRRHPPRAGSSRNWLEKSCTDSSLAVPDGCGTRRA